MSNKSKYNIHGSVGFVLNTKAALNDLLRPAIADLRTHLAPYEFFVEVAWEYSQIIEKVELLINRGVKTIIANGGDGTLNGVASAIVKLNSDVEMAVLPSGTANDFAHFLGLGDLDFNQALRKILTYEAKPIDIGYVESHDRYFLNVASAGFGAEITANTSSDLKRVIGGLAYIVSGITSLNEMEPLSIQLEADGFLWSQPTLGFAVGNGAQTGGGFHVCRRAKLDDGRLDLVVAPSMALDAFKGYFIGNVEESDDIVYGQFKEIKVRSENPFHMNLDGEPIIGDNFHIKVLPHALKLRMDGTITY